MCHKETIFFQMKIDKSIDINTAYLLQVYTNF